MRIEFHTCMFVLWMHEIEYDKAILECKTDAKLMLAGICMAMSLRDMSAFITLGRMP